MTHLLARVYASFFGLGFIRIAPGTCGSLAACIPAYWLFQIKWPVQVVIWAMLYVIGQWATEIIQQHSKDKDPSWVVIDEACAVWLLGILHPFLGSISHPVAFFICTFVLFRVFDIKKPWPVSTIDAIKTPWSVMCDDLAAMLMAVIVSRSLIEYIPPSF